MRPQFAIIWAVVGAYMLLPVNTGLDFPLIPPLDKTLVANLTVALLCYFLLRGRLKFIPKSTIGKILVAMFVTSPFLTVLTNNSPLFTGVITLPALTLHDSFSLLVRQFILVMPFFVGRQYLGDEEGHRALILVLVAAGLIYSFPMLLEVRLSPQLNNWIYGFFPHSFNQQVRFGGFRPVVFMGHGLYVAVFMAMALIAAAAAWRARLRVFRFPAAFIATYLAVILILCKTVGAVILGVMGVVLARLIGPRLQILFCAGIALTTLLYPMLRGADFIPTTELVSLASDLVNPQRAQSLEFRFDNEDLLMNHANEKPLFGWGTQGRNQVFDPLTGRSLATMDGRWIISIGVWGWYGYVAEFGLLTLPVVILWFRYRRRSLEIPPLTAAVCVVHCMNLLDLLPNSSLTPITILIAGALFGYAEQSDSLKHQRQKR